jgi:hypothetical protein
MNQVRVRRRSVLRGAFRSALGVECRVEVAQYLPPHGVNSLLNRILGYRTWELRSFNHLSSPMNSVAVPPSYLAGHAETLLF